MGAAAAEACVAAAAVEDAAWVAAAAGDAVEEAGDGEAAVDAPAASCRGAGAWARVYGRSAGRWVAVSAVPWVAADAYASESALEPASALACGSACRSAGGQAYEHWDAARVSVRSVVSQVSVLVSSQVS